MKIQTKDSTCFVFIDDFNFINKEQLDRKFNVIMSHKRRVIFPFNYSGLEIVYITKDGENYMLPSYRLDEDPRVMVDLPKGEYKLTLNLACFGNFVKRLTMKSGKEFKH